MLYARGPNFPYKLSCALIPAPGQSVWQTECANSSSAKNNVKDTQKNAGEFTYPSKLHFARNQHIIVYRGGHEQLMRSLNRGISFLRDERCGNGPAPVFALLLGKEKKPPRLCEAAELLIPLYAWLFALLPPPLLRTVQRSPAMLQKRERLTQLHTLRRFCAGFAPARK